MPLLGRNWRLQVENQTGVTIAINGCTIKARRYKFVSGDIDYDASEQGIFDNSGTIADGAYDESSAQDNSTADMLGGEFELTVTTTGSPSGYVAVYLQKSTDAGTTWPDDGEGQLVATIDIAASGTQVKHFDI